MVKKMEEQTPCPVKKKTSLPKEEPINSIDKQESKEMEVETDEIEPRDPKEDSIDKKKVYN